MTGLSYDGWEVSCWRSMQQSCSIGHCVAQAIQRMHVPHDGDSVSCCDICGVLDEECNLCALAVS